MHKSGGDGLGKGHGRAPEWRGGGADRSLPGARAFIRTPALLGSLDTEA